MKSSFIALLFISIAFACQSGEQRKLTIATAANMQYAMEELSNTFTENTGIDCEIVLGSSGKLTAQIMEGAPYDIFISADLKFPNTVYEAGLTLEEPKVYALGKLVLWTINEDFTPKLQDLSSSEIKHIALANPKTAPYGKAAWQSIQYYQLEKAILDKLVYGESISQTNQFILSGSAELGFTAKSVVISPQLKGKGIWVDLDPLSYTAIEQAAVLLKTNSEMEENARIFYQFLSSNEAKSILVRYGYDIP